MGALKASLSARRPSPLPLEPHANNSRSRSIPFPWAHLLKARRCSPLVLSARGSMGFEITLPSIHEGTLCCPCALHGLLSGGPRCCSPGGLARALAFERIEPGTDFTNNHEGDIHVDATNRVWLSYYSQTLRRARCRSRATRSHLEKAPAEGASSRSRMKQGSAARRPMWF